MSGTRRLARLLLLVCGAAAFALAGLPDRADAQQGQRLTPTGENFSDKPPAQLFASDCTGSGCHRGPQGLSKNMSAIGLASFLRAHYTNSRESAQALARYLVGIPASAEARGAKPQTPAVRARGPAEPAEAARPASGARTTQRGRPTPTPPVRPEAVAAAAEPAPEPSAPPKPQFDIFD